MRERLFDIINKEDKKKPYTDAQLAKLMSLRREIVTGLRKNHGIPDSRERRREILTKAIKGILKNNHKISERELTKKVGELGFDVSRHIIREYRKELNNNMDPKYIDEKNKNSNNQLIGSTYSYSQKKYSSFSNIIGAEGSLKPYIKQAKAAMLYPPHGLHTLILGPTGVGKSELAESMYKFSKEANIIGQKSHMVTFNCADYADNPQLLMSQLFGYVKGAFTGAESDKEGLVEKANGGILFLDEVHRLPPEGQELLFYLIDRGKFRRLGETSAQRQVKITIIAATTENSDSMLLHTFRRRIPMVIELPNLSTRPLSERLEIIKAFFSKEAYRIQTAIKVCNNVLRALLLYECLGNVGQLRSDIQVSCAKGFLNYVTNNPAMMEITIDDIPIHAKKGLLKTQNYRPEIEKLIKYQNLVVEPNKERVHPISDNQDMYNMPYEIYEFIEKRYHDLQGQVSNQEVINYIIGNEMQRKVENLLKKVETSIKPIEKKDLVNIVGIEIVELVDKILRIASWKLGIITDHLFYVLSVHLNTTLIRLKNGKTITNPQLKKIKEKYPKEFEVAKEMVEVINEELNVVLTEDEIGFISMYLSTVTDKEESVKQGRVGVLVATHGNVSNAMAEVANRLLGVSFAKAVNMSLDESPQTALDRTMEMVKSMDEGKGVLLLVDMGSLVTFGEIITKETGIKTKSVSRVDTVMVIEAIRRAMLPDSNLDEIADSIEEKTKYISRLTNLYPETVQKQKAIITMCITGQGTALKIKELLENIINKFDEKVKIIPIGAVENNIKELIMEIQKEHKILSIVGTVNPRISNIPYIALENIIQEKGLKKLENLILKRNSLEDISVEINIDTNSALSKLINRNSILIDMEADSKEQAIKTLANKLYEKGFVEKRFIQSVLDREKLGPTYFINGTSIPHGEPIYVNKPIIGVGVLKYPVNWGEVEVKIILMIALKSECIDVITELQSFCEDPKNIELISSCNEDEIISMLIS